MEYTSNTDIDGRNYMNTKVIITRSPAIAEKGNRTAFVELQGSQTPKYMLMKIR